VLLLKSISSCLSSCGSIPPVQGGALFTCRGAALISNCRLVENTARVSDGRIFSGFAWAINSHSHAAVQSGGALSVGFNGSRIRVQESLFESNHAKVCNSSLVSIIHDLAV
jgi:hypothetical protein